MRTRESIRDAALALDPEERAALIEDLLNSFDPVLRQEIDMALAVEAESRIDAYERGDLKSITLDESRRRIESL